MEKLALLGGKKLVKGKYPPYITVGQEEKVILSKVIDSGILSAFVANHGEGFLGGKYVQELENKWAKKFGTKYCVSLNSATSAIHAALYAVGVEPGDEVIVPPSTMSGCSAVVLALNGIPIFVDEDPESLCLDPDSIEKNITSKTKAIMPVHLTGNICEMGKIMEIAKKHDLKVIEDVSQAPDGKYKNRLAGTIGDIGVYSLNCHKIIQTGEGGIAVTDNKELAHRMRLFRNHGEKYAHFFEPDDPPLLAGLNLRMTELQAAVGIIQLKKIAKLTANRIKLAARLTNLIKSIDGIEPIHIYQGCKNVYYIFHMKYLEDIVGIKKSTFVKAANAEGIPLLSEYTVPLYLQPIFQKLSAYGKSGCPFKCRFARESISYPKGLCKKSESIAKTSVWIEFSRFQLTAHDIDMMYKCFQKIIGNKNKLKEYEKNINSD